ncbi:o-spanin [Stenotrophomonas phage Philippe]|uniref:O-spanin n=1 Tax=Stenotrophomonas phage Philippe TaxID=2859655 RepID=A0AAE7WML8_9CAUD|nr:o-spanin [Stenotrophomonas phage Philippe]QYW02281.1 o-spanin [Stenotrophomonas phage Philippe]
MNWLLQTRSIKLSLLALILICVSGCETLRKEPAYINVKPKLEPLNSVLLQSMQPDSTPLLKKGERWNKSTGQLLDSVTLQSKP